MDFIEFIAEVKKVESKTLVSLDKEARIVLVTGDLRVMDIGKWGPQETVTVRIERNGDQIDVETA